MTIAVIAAVTALYQAKLMRDQSRASVWPYLITGGSDHLGYYSLLTWNKGLGPAVIRSIEVFVDSQPVKNWREVKSKLGISRPWKINGTLTVGTGVVISQGETIDFLQLMDTTDNRADGRLFREAKEGRLDIVICYCSLYGDCWENRDHDNRPVKTCVVDPEKQFNTN
jgi:hypothetical protein